MRIGRTLVGLAVLAAAAAGAGYVLTAPEPLPETALAGGYEPDPVNGEHLFHVGGCASCHMTPGQEDRTRLGGGMALETPFGTFRAPNISSDPEAGIGAWSARDFANAMLRGISPEGRHYYPAFPYTSYRTMPVSDVLDLFAFMKTLPADGNVPAGHDLAFPYSVRRGVGLWKLAYADGGTFAPDPSKSAEWNRGAYLVNGPGHCGQCHTPRDAFGGLDRSRLLAGGPSPEGRGKVPAITAEALDSWSVADVAELLDSGFTSEYDSVGGEMAEVVRNTGQLPEADLKAIATYLKNVAAP